MKRRHPHKLWSEYSHRQRRSKWISLRWQIAQRARTGGHGVYWTQEDESIEPSSPLCNQWTDIYVPAQNGHTIWNMYLKTVRSAMWEEAEDLANDRVDQLLSSTERDEDWDYIRNSFSFTKVPGKKLYEMNFNREQPQFVSLNGKTKRQAIELETRKIIESGELSLIKPIKEEWEFAYDYAYGVGVHATVATSQLTPATIMAFLARFEANTPYQGDLPVEIMATTSQTNEHELAKVSVGFAQSRALKM